MSGAAGRGGQLRPRQPAARLSTWWRAASSPSTWSPCYADSGRKREARHELDDVEPTAWSTAPDRRGAAATSIAELEALLRAVTAGRRRRAASCSRPAAIHLLRPAAQRLTVRSAARALQPTRAPAGRRGTEFDVKAPYMATHGAISFSVDYSVLAAYVRRRRRARAPARSHEAASLTVVCLVLDEGAGRGSLLSRVLPRRAWTSAAPTTSSASTACSPRAPSTPDARSAAGPPAHVRVGPAGSSGGVFAASDASRRRGRASTSAEVVLDAVRRVEELYFPIGERPTLPSCSAWSHGGRAIPGSVPAAAAVVGEAARPGRRARLRHGAVPRRPPATSRAAVDCDRRPPSTSDRDLPAGGRDSAGWLASGRRREVGAWVTPRRNGWSSMRRATTSGPARAPSASRSVAAVDLI